MSGMLVEGLGSLVQTAGQTVVGQSQFQDLLKSGHDIHDASWGGSGGGGGRVISFHVRHDGDLVVGLTLDVLDDAKKRLLTKSFEILLNELKLLNYKLPPC